MVSAHGEMLITLELLIYPSLTLLILMAISCFFWSATQRSLTIPHHVTINVNKCASEDCVRCNKYETILKLASERYQTCRTIRAGGRLDESLKVLETEKNFTDELQQPNVFHVSELLALPWWTDEEFVSDVTILESSLGCIQEEFENVYRNIWPKGWLVNNTPTGQWAVYHLINQGSPVTVNCELCPKTYDILGKLISAMTGNVFANVSFSVVQPGTHITPHYGPTNIRIRCHLGLQVPVGDNSYLKVNNEKRHWKEGEVLLFDDSFQHEVVHGCENNQPRAVLLLDLWHPGLAQEERNTIDELFKFQTNPALAIRRIPLDTSQHVRLAMA